MQNNLSFWKIYLSHYYRKDRMSLLVVGTVVWFALVAVQVFATELHLPGWLKAPFPLLIAELVYLYACYRKYSAQ